MVDLLLTIRLPQQLRLRDLQSNRAQHYDPRVKARGKAVHENVRRPFAPLGVGFTVTGLRYCQSPSKTGGFIRLWLRSMTGLCGAIFSGHIGATEGQLAVDPLVRRAASAS
jgi:hypothetical protein